MSKSIKYLFLLSFILFLTTSCTSNKSVAKNTAEPLDSESNVTQLASSTPTPSQEPTPTPVSKPTPTPKALVLPTVENTTGKVLIQTVSGNTTYPYNSYIITSSKGESVVVDPSMMPPKNIVDINPAAIISTHSHPDHVDITFTNSYDCKKIMYKSDTIDTRDFHVFSFPSSHNGDNFNENSGNVIVVFEVDGLRIAHMGDVGQTYLTEEQITLLGDIDIAFMQFENTYSDMTINNEKGFNLIEQLYPRIIIPTHYTSSALPIFESKYGKITEYENLLAVSIDDLPDDNLIVYRITNNHNYK